MKKGKTLQQARKKCLKHYAITDQNRRGPDTIPFAINKEKVVARTMKMEAEKVIEAFSESQKIFKFLKIMKRKDVKVRKFIPDIDGRLGVNDIDKKAIWKKQMEKIINKENDWNQLTNTDVVLGPIQRVTCVEIINAAKKINLGKVAGPFEVNTEMIVASGKIGEKVIVKLCRHVLDGKRNPDE